VGVAHAGTGPTPDDAYRAALVERDGWRVAFVAVTSVFNSTFAASPARDFVAWADAHRVAEAIAAARAAGADLVFVSHHGGVEYGSRETDETRAFARACVEAGADGFIGHHPHVVQGVEWYRGRPIFYSLGNFLFRQNDPWTDRGLAVVLTARDGEDGLQVEYLPVAVDFRPRFLDAAEGGPVLARVAQLSGGSLDGRPRGGAGD
jgi:poly-gamma-glutamate capsule biosynthesis protein CapA/YwtB (metallophosphatase superfamily)